MPKTIKEINEILAFNTQTFDFIIVDLFKDFDNQDYLDSLKRFSKKLFVLSDEPKQFNIKADAVFAFSENQELFNYNNFQTKYYTGLKYFPLHSKFQEIARKKVNKKVANVLLTFGGSDPNNFTCKTISTFPKEDQKHTRLILAILHLAHSIAKPLKFSNLLYKRTEDDDGNCLSQFTPGKIPILHG